MGFNHFKLKTFIILTAIIAGIPFAAKATNLTDSDTINALPSSLQNTSFEEPNIWRGFYLTFSKEKKIPITLTAAELNNPPYGSNNKGKFYWNTTASDDKTAVWLTSYTDKWKAAKDGEYFYEINANEEATLYQNIKTAPGSKLKWGVTHACHVPKAYDTMALVIGPAQQTDTIKKENAADDDVFKTMLTWLTEKENLTHDSHVNDSCQKEYVVYSKELNNSITASDEYFSLTSSTDYQNEWHIWFMTDNDRKWYNYGINYDPEWDEGGAKYPNDKDAEADIYPDYNYTYTVPQEQDATIFAFVSVVGHSSDGTSNVADGNFIDDVHFEAAYPLTVYASKGGRGDFTVDKLPYSATFGDIYSGLKSADTDVEITITPETDSQYRFVGLIDNDNYISASQLTSENGIYNYSSTMTFARNIRLIFLQKSMVAYDPNGGTFNGTRDTSTEVVGMDKDLTIDTNGEVSGDEGMRFIGWYLAENQKIIQPGHKITYNNNGTPNDATDDLIDVEYKVVGSDEVEHISLSADDGALFIAQWEYEQSAVAMTNNNSDSYTEDETGGYVLTNINDERVGNDSYAIVNDYVRMTAVEKSGYEFSGWYDEKGNRLSENRVYEYAVRSSNKVYARFTSLIESYVSFVAESDNIELDDEDTPFENGSHIINTTTNQELSITGGENGYGNTISTGFVATTRFTGNVTNCIWRVTIHPDDTYVKVPFGASEMPYDFELSETPVLTDSEDVKVKRGAIYEVQGEDKSVYIFNDAMPVTISGNGTVEATYSLILDNIYAPYATAVMQFGTVGDDATDATSDDSNIFHVGEDEEFKTHSNNPYHTTNNNQKEKISE